jgi:peptidoglycan/xylan/chitin deacetylase (PgdA/CDA1 family)
MQRSGSKKNLSKRLLQTIFYIGLFDVMHRLWPNKLTVLGYHRIANLNEPDFDTFKPNVSATPAAFAAQLDYISDRFNAVSIGDVVAWLRGEQALPANPVLITFDDGYRDNLDHALPILQERRIPAVIFLATNYIGQASPFYWDLIAYCFHHTSKNEVNLPLVGRQTWHDEKSRSQVLDNWLGALKKLPDNEKWAITRRLPQAVDLSIPEDAFAGLHLTWDQVRTMVAAGVDVGAHTESHPILTRISLEQARREIAGSKRRIEAELDRPVTAFAYPNGLTTDFNPALQAVLREAGFEAAFTLVPGPARLTEAQRDPIAIRRIFVHHKDTLPRFAAKVMGIPRLGGVLG